MIFVVVMFCGGFVGYYYYFILFVVFLGGGACVIELEKLPYKNTIS